MNKGIYWFASYPKSGNTWLRILLSNYILDLGEPADINNIEINYISSNREAFDKYLCMQSSDLTLDEIKVYQPDLYKEWIKNSKKDLYIKAHDAYILNKDSKPIFPSEVTKGVLYIVRNPLDIVVSYANHRGLSIKETIKNLNDSNFAIAKSEIDLDKQISQILLSWSEHVNSWIDSKLPIKVLRYEDMLENTYDTFYEALTFLGIEVEKERLEKAIRFSSFKELQKQEQKNSFKEKPNKADMFFKSGKKDSYKDVLTEKMIKDIKEKNFEVMSKFGYL